MDRNTGDNGRSAEAFTKLWQSLDETERALILYLIYSIPPVSVDMLITLSGASAVKILKLTDKLLIKKILTEQKETGKGFYFFDKEVLRHVIEPHVPHEEMRKAAQKVFDFYSQSLNGTEDRSFHLAELYRESKNIGAGLPTIKDAADFLLRPGQKEKTIAYYEDIPSYISENEPTAANAVIYLDSLLCRLAAGLYLVSVQEQKALLTKAREIARRHKLWDYLARIQLALGRALQDSGASKEASRCINDFLRLSSHITDPRLLRITSVSVSEFFAWKGRFSQAIRHYEAMVGSLEEFEEDEQVLLGSLVVAASHFRCGRVARGLGMIDAVRIKAKSLNFEGLTHYCDLWSASCFCEIQKVAEAETYLNRILSLPEDSMSHHLVWTISNCKAYILSVKGEYEEAFKWLQKSVEHQHFIGMTYRPVGFPFECLSILESKGFFHEEMNLDTEINRMLNWDDIHLKGVAFRYKALRNSIASHSADNTTLSDLINSEKYLKQAGAQIQLAQTWVALGRYFLEKRNIKTAQPCLSKAWHVFSTIDNDLFPHDLLDVLPQNQRIESLIDRITRINESLGTIRNVNSFLERVINTALDFFMAKRGAFFDFDPSGTPRIVASRNFDTSSFQADTLYSINKFVQETAAATDETAAHYVRKAGSHERICMPARLGDKTYGFLYLDEWFEGKVPDNYLPFIRMLCSQIALGLNNISAYTEVNVLKDRFEHEAHFYRREMVAERPLEAIVGKSVAIKNVLNQIPRFALTDSAILITGETGVGKELVAKAIHHLSGRKNGPFIPVNLTVLPQELVASELFGHEKGAFTGAAAQQKGRFEIADGGTIFLDEIGDLPHGIQIKLLRVLQEKTFERLGSSKTIRSDFRIIAATNKNLATEVENGRFRQDLFYRINVFPIHVPPLRERGEDIPLLAQHFIEKFGRKIGKEIKQIPNKEMKKLMTYHWPGNVRELENVIERAVVLSDGHLIGFSGLEITSNHIPLGHGTVHVPLADITKWYVEEVLNTTRWKVGGPNGAAEILGLKPTTLFALMKRYGIQRTSNSHRTGSFVINSGQHVIVSPPLRG